MSNNNHDSIDHALDSIAKPVTDKDSVMGAENIIKPNTRAQNAASEEKTMSLRQALKLYPKAIGWSVLLSSTLIMEGYDLALLGSLYASPQFNKKFGVWNDSAEKYAVPASWQSALSNGARAGEVIGLLINGIASDRFGYRKTMIASLCAMIAFIFVLFFAPNIQVLVLGEVLCGIPWGVFQTLSTAYASEVSPVILRPYLTTFVNMCWVMGQFIAAGVNRASVTRGDQWAYKIPFAIQWVWPPLILAGVIFAPESPWWHVRQGDNQAARRALLRITSKNDPSFDPDETIAMIEHTNELEKSLKAGTTYWDCFKGVDLRRTEIVCILWLGQTLTGQNLMGYFSYFMTQAGMDTVHSFDLSLAQMALGLIGTVGSWFLMSRVGRRTIHLCGVCTLFSILLIIGCISFAQTNASLWATGAMLITFTFFYDFTVGPITYSLISELSSTRLKAKTIVLARSLYNISNIVVNVLTNYQLSTTAWNWGARTAFFWAGTCGCVLVWVYYRLPEPQGRTYGELDLLFEQRVSARKFKGTKVDPYGDGTKSSSVD
ncbi:hypothetical protein N8I77_011810 [Diaporthe amygdali]|uniref:Major facilitator superfamily (MFS) profile domain-containing protein n=1 Tax=Phomopsis amygdali TaxID=1214568 RepID=A0AAD9S4F9_PHOAM|nr:hypothetical protein N8I77_011810 [Diaporthe amygdali]